ncbi:MAG TPA: transcriptional regulator NrdR [Solirubrobacterales bacterium]
MRCPRCESRTSILETRRAEDGDAVRRRRQCSGCGHRFTTYERAVPEIVTVVKRDGRRQPFDREKLLGGLIRASHKRDVDPRELEAIVDRIETDARRGSGELDAKRIGELCLRGLELLDPGAYLQFAGTLPDSSGNPRKYGTSEVANSVRGAEDAAVLTPETEREEKS